jgi:hypothetical protein
VYFVYVYDNRTMKPVQFVLRRGKEGLGRMTGRGVNLIKIHS